MRLQQIRNGFVSQKVIYRCPDWCPGLTDPIPWATQYPGSILHSIVEVLHDLVLEGDDATDLFRFAEIHLLVNYVNITTIDCTNKLTLFRSGLRHKDRADRFATLMKQLNVRSIIASCRRFQTGEPNIALRCRQFIYAHLPR